MQQIICRHSGEQDGELDASSSNSHVLRKMVFQDEQGAALLEFAISLPLLVCSSWHFRFQRRIQSETEIEQAAQEGAIIAGAQPMSDIATGILTPPGPSSLQPVVTAVSTRWRALESCRMRIGKLQPSGNVTAPFSSSGLTLCPDVPMIWSSPLTVEGHHLDVASSRRHHRNGHVPVSLAI